MIWPACVLQGSGKTLMIYEQLNFSLYMNLKEVQFHVEVLSSITNFIDRTNSASLKRMSLVPV